MCFGIFIIIKGISLIIKPLSLIPDYKRIKNPKKYIETIILIFSIVGILFSVILFMMALTKKDITMLFFLILFSILFIILIKDRSKISDDLVKYSIKKIKQ